jgi:hypothetical protein
VALSSAVDEAEQVPIFGEMGSRSPYLRSTPGFGESGEDGGDEPPALSLDSEAVSADAAEAAARATGMRIRASHGRSSSRTREVEEEEKDEASGDESEASAAASGAASSRHAGVAMGSFVPGHRLASEKYNPGSKSRGMRPRSDSHDHVSSPKPERDGAGGDATVSAAEKRKQRRKRKGREKAVAAATAAAEAELEALTADPFPPPQKPGLVSLLPGELLVGSVDEFEKRRHTELATRDSSLPVHQRSKAPFETRQWSHKKRDNPLFDRLREPQRRIILSRAVNSVDGGIAELSKLGREQELSLAELRKHRDASGCRCVSAAHNIKKMTAKRLRESLQARGLPVDGTRAELAARFREAAAAEPLCSATGGEAACPCASAGVPCNYDVCRCDCDACRNPLGYESYSRKAVKAHVKRMIREAGTRGASAAHSDGEAAAASAQAGDDEPQAAAEADDDDDDDAGASKGSTEQASGETASSQRRQRNRSKSMCG